MTFKDGETNGKVGTWYEDGQKRSEGNFKDGERIDKKIKSEPPKATAPPKEKGKIFGGKLSNWGDPDRTALTKTKADYTLYCDICGEEIVKIKKEGENSLIISSPLRRFGIEVHDIKKASAAIEKHDLPYLHDLLKEEDGLDFYCPECDKLYCEKHYILFPYWDGPYYDYTEGQCPQGHTRIVDD